MTEQVDELFPGHVRALSGTDARQLPETLSRDGWLELFDSQLRSRCLDLAARWLRGHDKGFYTIGSAGHEANAAVAAALRPTDPALLHYRSGGFYLQRATQVEGHDPVRDVLLGVVAATEDPISGGRHKVFGNADLSVIPQTSTIASHLPRAVGVAFSIARAHKLGVETPWPEDAVTVCSFGDASANHSTAVGALNTAANIGYRGLPMPLLFVCEDNGIGISVRTPSGWIEHTWTGRHGLSYFSADGFDPAETVAVAQEAADWVRRHRRPAFLHLRTVRLMGHAGSDVESAYRSPEAILGDIRRDPLLGTAALLVQAGVLTPDEVVERYDRVKQAVIEVAAEVVELPQISSAEDVMEPLRGPEPCRVAELAVTTAAPASRAKVFGRTLPEEEGPLTLAQSINRTLLDLLAQHRQLVVFGEDVGAKGGVYGVTRMLQRRVGEARVFDTVLDEQAILGLALGAGVSGLVSIPEIQYLAYLHNAEDQLRGEAATLPFFSAGQYHNPMVVRVAGYAYQKGFGGHFHNDNAVAVLRDVPGVVVASPSRPEDAAAMMRSCVAAAVADGTTCVYLEPIALYHTKDLYEPGDGQWLAPYAAPDSWSEAHAPIGQARTHGNGDDLTILTFGNGLPMSLRVAARLRQHGIEARVQDLRWLAPLPVEDMLRDARATGRVLVVDETRASGGVSEGVFAALLDHGYRGALARVTSADSIIPLGDAANLVLLSEETIEEAALKIVRSSSGRC